MRGHLGTELANKVSDTFNIEKKKNADGIVFEVSQSDARGKDVENWTFCITDACGKLGIPSIVSANPIAARQVNGKTAFENRDFQNMTPREWVDVCLKLDEIFANKSVYKTSDLIEEIKEKFNSRADFRNLRKYPRNRRSLYGVFKFRNLDWQNIGGN